MTIASVAALFVVGGTVIGDTRADAEQAQMENAMASFSSKASLVGLGESGNQRFSLGRVSEGDVTVKPNAGKVTMWLNTSNGDVEEIGNTSLGAMVYHSDGTEIAYQGGGVWTRQGSYSRMISPPEYHYQLSTLTFPIVTIRGEGRSGGAVRGKVRSGADINPWFPAPDNNDFSNPLDNGTVTIEIESRYCTGWETFFSDRSQGSIKEQCGDNETVVVDLVVPFELSADKTVIARSVTEKGNVDADEYETSVNAPSVSSEVDTKIEDCEGSCEPLLDSGTVNAGTYWSESDYDSTGDLTFNTSGGDVEAVINGDIDLNGDVVIEGGGNVTFYVHDDVNLQPRDFNVDGNATQLSILVHTSGETVDLTNSLHYVGIIYAPGSNINIGGKATIEGSIVGDTVNKLHGNANITGVEELDGYQIVGGNRPLTYFHVSENAVEVDFD